MLHNHAIDFSVFHRALLEQVLKLALMQEVGPKDGTGYLLEFKERRYWYQYSRSSFGPSTQASALLSLLCLLVLCPVYSLSILMLQHLRYYRTL